MSQNPENFNVREVNNTLFLPPYHCTLNPIELYWSLLKRKIRDGARLDSKLPELAKVAENSLKNILLETTEHMFERVKKKEAWFREINGIKANKIDQFVINLDDDYDESDSDESIEFSPECAYDSDY